MGLNLNKGKTKFSTWRTDSSLSDLCLLFQPQLLEPHASVLWTYPLSSILILHPQGFPSLEELHARSHLGYPTYEVFLTSWHLT